MKRLTTEEFIKRAKENGYTNFDYSKVNYINNSTKVCIICPIHGELYLNPTIFFKPNKIICKYCSKKEDNSHGFCYTNEEYLKLIKEKYKNSENLLFDKINYITSHQNIIVTCKYHGDLLVKPYHLLNSTYNCPICNRENKENKTAKKYYNKFILKAKEKWPNIDYSITTLPKKENRYKKYKIICPTHGEQEIIDNTFLKCGCPKCEIGINKGKTVNRNYTNEEFINELKNVYGDKYDYSEVNYINWSTKVKLKCEKHGWFYREPVRLIHDIRGCPYCQKSLLEDKIANLLDENNIEYIREYNTKFLGHKRIDFYLPKYNCGIECQGKQHFYQNSIFNGLQNQKIEDILQYDENKYKLCIENGLNVYYITNVNFKGKYFTTLYKDFNEMLNKILIDNE